MQSTVNKFIDSKLSEDSRMQVSQKKEAPNRIVLPFRDQKSANAVSKQLGDLSVKVSVDISLMYSRKIKDEIKVREDRPPLVNQQCIVYHLNVTCVMRVIRVIHADTYTNKLRKTKNQK